MKPIQTPLWTLDELCAQVAQTVALDSPGVPDSQLRGMFNKCILGQYTTLGLFDPPIRMRGRTALYGERHLLQLVAIKRLQARGRELPEIMKWMVRRGNDALRLVARWPAFRPEADETEHRPAEQASEDQQRETARTTTTQPEQKTTARPMDKRKKKRGLNVSSVAGVVLGDGVTLLLKPTRSLDGQDVEALRSAAAELLEILKTRRIVNAERAVTNGSAQGDSS